MREQREWTLVTRNVNNKYVRTNHYYTKAKAVEELRYLTNLGYIVTMMTYGIYRNINKEELEK